MSLINEALRKVQNQRTQTPELGSDTKNPSFNYTDRPNQTGLMIGLGVSIIILIGLIVGLTVILISKDGPKTAQQPVSDKSEAFVSEKVTPTSTSKTAKESTKSGTELSTPEIVEMPAAKPSQEIVDWLAQSRITGVRITHSSSKVILNNEAFMPGDSVNMNLGLKILEIEAQRIILIDSNGVKYVKLL